MSDKILLIDGHSILNRAFYGLPDLTNSEGRHTGAVYGFLNILFRILDEEKPKYLTVAFDLHEPTFRHKMYDAYKGTRKPMPEELREQVPLIKEVLTAMGIKIVSKPGFEADDLLGTLAVRSEKKGMDVTILSGDRDLLQLATDKVLIRLPKTSRGKTTIENFHTQEVVEKYQVTPPQIIELKALMGDSADNIPGIPGVGEKTATKMIVEFGSIENAYAHLEEVKPNKAKESLREHYDMAVLSKTLATINTDSPIDYSYEEAELKNLYTPEAYQLCKQLEFKNLLSKFDTAVMPENEQNFFSCSDLSGVDTLFKKASDKTYVGISLLADKENAYGLGIALDKEEIYYIPVEGLLTGDFLCASLKDLAKTTVLCALDIKQFLKHVPLEDETQVFDIGIGAYLLNPLKSTYTYDDIAKEYLDGVLLPAREDLLGKDSLKKAWESSADGLMAYSCYMAYTAFASRIPIENSLKDCGMWQVYREIELPLIFTLDSMEKYGICVKGEELKTYGKKLQVRIEELEKQIYEAAGEEFNINSPKQLGTILFEKMGLPGGRKTKTGYSTAADILEKLAAEHPIVKDILEYRQLAKLKSTYADGLAAVIEPDGRIHSTFNQTITATGRISSTEPNLQNIPVRMELGRLIRKVFVPEDGYVFLDADYSQIELRVLAHMSGDETLIQAYREAQDIHRLTASQVFHVPFEEVTSLQRRNAKAVNFGIIYGIGAFSLSKDIHVSVAQADQYIKNYLARYPRVAAFMEEIVEHAKELGYVSTYFKRRRPVPELRQSNKMIQASGKRIAMNTPIQGTAADIIKIAMIHVSNRLQEECPAAKLILQVHDELIVEVPEQQADLAAQILKEEMEHVVQFAVPLTVEVKKGKSWYDAKG